MTPVQRVHRVRTFLAGTVAAAAALWAAASVMAALLLIAIANVLGLLPTGAHVFIWPFAIAVGLSAVAAVLWRQRAVWSVERVALWLEERVPQLKYTLVTLVDSRYSPAQHSQESHAALLEAASRTDFESIVRRSAGRTLAWAVGACLLTGGVVSLLQATTKITPLAGIERGPKKIKILGNRLLKLQAEVIPPAYSGLPRHVVNDPTDVAGLYGTKIRFLGDGPPDSILAIYPRDTIVRDTIAAVTNKDDSWAVPVPIPELPGVLRLEDRKYRRSVSLEPLTDSVPRLLLQLPVKDTTWRWDQAPKGWLALEADITDDYGISSAFFEILASSGSAEQFETMTCSTAPVSFGGKRQGTLRAAVNYGALTCHDTANKAVTIAFTAGSVLHIRAMAFDNNNVADSAGRGISETRTLRVGTKQEADTTNVTPAPPLPIDSFFVSQRLLNMRTDTLLHIKKKVLPGKSFNDTSQAYSTKQDEIRNRVEKVIMIVEDDGVGGRIETDLSRLLRAASEQMYQAFTYLAINMPDSAYTPPKSHMKEALRLLDEARKAQKYYIRGALQVRPVNIAGARLQGKDDGKAANRTARDVPEDVRRDLRKKLTDVVSVAIASPEEALESLMQIKTRALLGGAQSVAAALQEAIDLAHKGKSTATALARAQRLLDRPARVTTGPAEWGGGQLP